MNRRETIGYLSATLCAAGAGRAVLAAGALTARSSAAKESLDERLKRDAERMAPRVYSDEGIPMLLACIDLTRQGGAGPQATPLNARFARELADNGAAWERLHPDAKPEDVSKVLEVLAERDFRALIAGASR